MKSLIYTDNTFLASALNRYNKYCKSKENTKFTSIITKSNFNTALSIIDFLNNEEISNEVFDENVISLFPAFQISNKCEVIGPLEILNLPQAKLKDDIQYILSVCDLYSKFKDKVEDYFDDKRLLWKNGNNNLDKEQITIVLLNIQNGNLRFWNQLSRQILSKLPVNTYFIFYWMGELKRTLTDSLYKNDVEYNDIIWGYSRFLRDFLEARNIGFELEIPIIEKSETNSIFEFILNDKKLSADLAIIKNKITRPTENEYQDNSSKYFNLLEESLKGICGDNFPTEEILTKERFWEQINKYFIFNKNRFADNLEDIQKRLLDNTSKGDVSSHGILREIDGWVRSYSKDNFFSGLGNLEFWLFLRKNISALLNAVVNYKTYKKDEGPIFLFIDDNYQPIEEKIPIINIWFPESKFYYTANFNWKSFLNHQIDDCLSHNLGIVNTYAEGKFSVVERNNICSLKPDFIVVDLEYNGLLVGHDIIRRLKNAIIAGKRNMHIIVFSRFDDPYIIRKSINSGALLYVTKANYLRIINKIFLLKFNYKEDKGIRFSDFENWHKLSKLDPAKLLELRSERIEGSEYNIAETKSIYGKNNISESYQWIFKLPKADLHCHIGSCIGADLLPVTAAVVLANKYKSLCINEENNKKAVNVVNDKEKKKKDDENKLKLVIQYLIPFVADPNLNEDSRKKKQPQKVIEIKNSIISLCNLSNFLSVTDKTSIFEILTIYLKDRNYKKSPEEILLSPLDTTLDRLWYKNPLCDSELILEKLKLRKEKITYAEVMLCFILLLYYRDTNDNNYCNLSGEINKKINRIERLPRINEELKSEQIKLFLDKFYSILTEINSTNEKIVYKKENILAFLQSARSNKRCLKANGGSLFNYLRGCEYGGAEHLQTTTSIYLVSDYIVNEYARKFNIRYLDLRCAADGYSSMGMQSQEEAMEALLTGFDFFTHQKGEKKIHINVILTAKRHKTVKEVENNVNLALKYRYGLALNDKDYNKDYQSYFDSPTRIISFDLAGIEKGNRPSKFYQQFLPLLRDCFPITIHAGEEDDYESIWEAIYLLQSQRIGHALTLRNKKELLEYVRERHITIELCPISNYLTKNKDKEKYYFRLDKDFENDLLIDAQTYPLRQYLQENLDVTINTDNPFVNNAEIVQEYLFAAKLSGGLTKWEILRLIKNSFRGTAISKKEKRKLMNEIENEIFEILSDEER